MRRDFQARIDAVEMVTIHDAQNTGHLERLGRIDAEDLRVGIGAQERRAVNGIRQIRQILDVLRPAGHFVLQVDARRSTLNFRF